MLEITKNYNFIPDEMYHLIRELDPKNLMLKNKKNNDFKMEKMYHLIKN